MNANDTSTPGGEPSSWRLLLERLRLRFRDPTLESAYRADRFRHDLGNIRFAFLAGIALWVTWGLLLRPLHAGPVRSATRPAHAVRRVHPHVGRRLRAHVHPVLRARLGMGVGRHRSGDARVLGLLRLAGEDVAARVRIRRRHPDHGVHLHAAPAPVRLGRARHRDRHRHLPSVRLHGTVQRPRTARAHRALPRLVRHAGRAGCLPDGTVHATAVPPRTAARAGTDAVRRAPAQHAARGDRRAAQDRRPAAGSRRASNT